VELGLGPSHPLEGKGPVGAVLCRLGHEDPEDEGLGQLEVPGEDVGLILEVLDNAEDPLFRGGRDASTLVQDTVDRADGDTG